MKDWKPYYLGNFHATEESYILKSPGTFEELGQVFLFPENKVHALAESISKAYETTQSLPVYKRAEILRKLAHLLQDNKDELAGTLALEAGKPIVLARGEVDRAILTTRWAAGEAERWGGEMMRLDVMPGREHTWALYFRVPVGPLLAFTPFNFPLNLTIHKIAPAIALGIPFVIKPSPRTPITSIKLTELLLQAGWPEHACAVIPCSNETALKLVEMPEFPVFSFTGSAQVGWFLKSKAPQKKVILELGGNAGVIIHKDLSEEDIREAGQRCAWGAYVYAGQVCISVQRIYVHENIASTFLESFLTSARSMKVGPIFESDTLIGPMIDSASADRVESWVQESLKHGAEVLLEGKRDRDWLSPFLLTRVAKHDRLNCDEVFGPVAVFTTYRDFDSAIAFINDSRFGLQAGVFTRDWNLIQKAIRNLQVGGVIIQDVPTFRVDPMPYGGSKASGFEREGIRFAMEAMTEIRTAVFRKSTLF